MVTAARAYGTSRRRTVGYALGAAVLLMVLVAGLVFTNAIRVTRVTNNARALHWTNASIGTSALTRAGLVQAVTFAELADRGSVDRADRDFAMDQVSASVDELESLREAGEAHESRPELGEYIGSVNAAISELERGDVLSAKETVVADVENAYTALSDSLQMEQESIQLAIDDNSADARAINEWIVFALILGIPGAAVVVYFVVARRQVRALKERIRFELDAEREINRAKDSFIAGLSHELRTPLTSIYGFAEVLADGEVQGREATEQTAEIIANEAAEMTRMVDDLLAASRLDSTGLEIEMAPIDLREAVEGAMSPFARLGLDIQWEPESLIVHADGARLRHVLVNLISNAVRHGGPTRGIEVTEAEGAAEIRVWDDGAGVPEDRSDRLFQRFVHNDDAPLLTGSVGLGLAVASKLTGLMGGALRYERSDGITCFVVEMPLSDRDGEGSLDGGAAEPAWMRTLSE